MRRSLNLDHFVKLLLKFTNLDEYFTPFHHLRNRFPSFGKMGEKFFFKTMGDFRQMVEQSYNRCP